MRAFLFRRLLQSLLTLLGISALTFLLLQLAPGDYLAALAEDPQVSATTLAALRERFGLDQPWWLQYLLWLRNVVLHLDFGESFSRHRPVFDVLREGLGPTLLLAGAGALVTWLLALPLGVLAAMHARRWPDRLLQWVSGVALAVPELVSGLLLLWFAAASGAFPVSGLRDLDHDQWGAAARALDVVRHLALPALVVALVPFAVRMRQMRAAMLEQLASEPVEQARALGLPESQVVLRHALPNALNPMVTLFGMTLGALLSGSFVAETLFSWPGLGSLTLDALLAQDTYLVVGAVLMVSVVLAIGHLLADVLQAVIDPRVRHD